MIPAFSFILYLWLLRGDKIPRVCSMLGERLGPNASAQYFWLRQHKGEAGGDIKAPPRLTFFRARMFFYMRLLGDHNPSPFVPECTACFLESQCLIIGLAISFHPQLLCRPSKLQLPQAPRLNERVLHLAVANISWLFVDVIGAKVREVRLEKFSRNTWLLMARNV